MIRGWDEYRWEEKEKEPEAQAQMARYNRYRSEMLGL